MQGDCEGRLRFLALELGGLDRLVIDRGHDGLTAAIRHREPEVERVRVVGRIRHSLSAALASAGVGAGTAARMAAVFSPRMDLARALRRGDRFALIYEQRHLDGRRLADGALYAAQLSVAGNTLRAFRRADADGQVRYYDADGLTLRPMIERAPLRYRRVSSPFAERRRHPITGRIRPHHGVDFAAPTGTPVHAGADGIVRFRGRAGGYGRFIEIDHRDHYQSRYGHLSAYARGLHVGDAVQRGQLIGYVGSSGLSTGPHLHYEIRRNGVPHDPLHMPLPGRQLEGAALARYKREIAPRLADLAAQDMGSKLAGRSVLLCIPMAEPTVADAVWAMPRLAEIICPMASNEEGAAGIAISSFDAPAEAPMG